MGKSKYWKTGTGFGFSKMGNPESDSKKMAGFPEPESGTPLVILDWPALLIFREYIFR
jgi:hypothetical protein